MSSVYRIRVKNHLEPYWEDWFGGMALTNLGKGEAELVGLVEDQAALHRILEKIRDLNIGLISIEQVEDDQEYHEAEMDKTGSEDS